MTATWTGVRDTDSMLVRTATVELMVSEDGRSESDAEYDEDDEDEDEAPPVYGTCGGRVAVAGIVGKMIASGNVGLSIDSRPKPGENHWNR
jgi:hypothetical protein